jgi:hypothetical protein
VTPRTTSSSKYKASYQKPNWISAGVTYRRVIPPKEFANGCPN